MLPVSELKPYAKNARTHSKPQVEQIAASIREFGWTNPVLIRDDLTIIAGHGRVLAAKAMGQIEVPCIRLSHLTDTQARAYVIADNKLAIEAGWDDETLGAELSGLLEESFDAELTGFSTSEIDALLGKAGEPTADEGIDYQEKFSVLVECDDETHQATVFDNLSGQGLRCKVLVN